MGEKPGSDADERRGHDQAGVQQVVAYDVDRDAIRPGSMAADRDVNCSGGGT